jgi:hypothetical protein
MWTRPARPSAVPWLAHRARWPGRSAAAPPARCQAPGDTRQTFLWTAHWLPAPGPVAGAAKIPGEPADPAGSCLDELSAADRDSRSVRETVPASAQAAPQVPAVYLPPFYQPERSLAPALLRLLAARADRPPDGHHWPAPGTAAGRRAVVRRLLAAGPVRFTVYPDAAYIANDLFTGYAGGTANELTGWISVQHPTVTLAAGASALDMITIKVPAGATRGEHYGVIWVQQTAQARAATGFGVIEVSRVGIRVYLAVGKGGAPPTSFAITSITASRSASGQPSLIAHVDNTGGRAVDLDGSARLADGPGNSNAGPFPAQKIITLAPGQTGNITFTPPKSLPTGSWRVTIYLVSGITTATATAAIQFSPIVAAQAGLSGLAWTGIALGALVLALVLVMGRYALQHRRTAA